MNTTTADPEATAIGEDTLLIHRGWRLEVIDDGDGQYSYGVKVTRPNGAGCYIGATRFDNALSAVAYVVRFIDAGGRQ